MDRSKLTRSIVIAMIAGFALGSTIHWLEPSSEGVIETYFVSGLFDIGGQVFIATLKLLVVPLVLFPSFVGPVISRVIRIWA